MKPFAAIAFSAAALLNAQAAAHAQTPAPPAHDDVRRVETALRILPRLDEGGRLTAPFSYYRGRMVQADGGRIRFVQDAPNGVLEPDEQASLRVFQQTQGLNATGTITPETMDRMDDLFSVDATLTRFDIARSSSPLRDTVAALLLNEISAGETDGNNNGPDITRYFGSAETGAWCAAVVTWGFREAARIAGVSTGLFNGADYYLPRVAELHRFGTDNNAFVGRDAGRVPARGDILIHRYLDNDEGSTGHAQLVVDVRRDAESGDVILVIAEGNATRPTTLPDPAGGDAQYVVLEGNVMMLTTVSMADLEDGATSEYAGFIDIGALPGFAQLDAALGRADLSQVILTPPEHRPGFGTVSRVDNAGGHTVITDGVPAPFNPNEIAALQVMSLRAQP